jgi:hypothetical protein
VNSTNIWVQFRKAIESFTLNMTEIGPVKGGNRAQLQFDA